jgi:lipid II:glycine glycyltransferase (peptidoglycan interpeptide bridge formation enzyme)
VTGTRTLRRAASAGVGLRVTLSDRLTPAEESEVTAFVEASACASYLQRPDWLELVRGRAGHTYRIATCRGPDGALLATAVLRFSSLAPGRSLAFARRGPITRRPEDLELVLPELAKALHRAGVVTLQLNPRWAGAMVDRGVSALSAVGCAFPPRSAQGMHTATAIIDLDRDEEQLLASLKQRCRHQIRKSIRMGLVVRHARDLDDAMRYAPVLEAFHRERGLSLENTPTVANQWRMTRRRGVFLLAEHEGRVVGGHVAVADGDRAFWLSLASRDDVPDLPRNYLLLWEAIRSCRQQGFKAYDMAGAPEPERLERGELEDGEGDRYQFKRSFSPRLERLMPLAVLPVRPLEHRLLYGLRGAYREWAGR